MMMRSLFCFLLFFVAKWHTVSTIDCFTFPPPNQLNLTTIYPTLPDNAVKVTCPTDDSICFIAHSYIVAKDDSGSVLANLTTYQWGCFFEQPVFQSSGGYKCSEKLEQSTNYVDTYGDNVFGYGRLCFCCGDQCNGHELDGHCSEQPIFSHNCYGATDFSGDGHSQYLPSSAVSIPCTETQHCAKLSNHNKLGNDYYEWGCFSMPADANKCGQHSAGVDDFGNHQKVCTCCGDLCNDAQAMDWIVASDDECEKPSNSNDQTLTTVSAVLGSLIFVTLVALALAILMIVKLKKQLANNSPDQQQIIQE